MYYNYLAISLLMSIQFVSFLSLFLVIHFEQCRKSLFGSFWVKYIRIINFNGNFWVTFQLRLWWFTFTSNLWHSSLHCCQEVVALFFINLSYFVVYKMTIAYSLFIFLILMNLSIFSYNFLFEYVFLLLVCLYLFLSFLLSCFSFSCQFVVVRCIL